MGKNTEWKIAIIIDTGSGFTKVGLASDIQPRHIFPSVVAHPKTWISNNLEIKIGESSCHHIPTYPIQNGVIREPDDFKMLEKHSIDLLNVTTEEHPIMLTHAMVAPKKDKEDRLEFIFEELDAPAATIVNQSKLALFAAGRTTGVVVDCGEGSTLVVPIVDGKPVPHAIRNLEIGGCDLTNNLANSLRHHLESGQGWLGRVRNIKETTCYVALDYEAEKRNVKEVDVDVPGRHNVVIGSDRFRIPELLFEKNGGLPHAIFEAIMSCPENLQATMFQDIVVAGGSSKFPGFVQRLEKDLKSLAPKDTKICLIALDNPDRLAWYGGAVLASSENLQMSPWITKDQYLEKGASVVHTAPY